MRRPIMVLRPVGPVEMKHPHTAHVTLRGFYEADHLDDVLALVREWGASQHPIEVTTEAIDTFPAPWQIVIARLARTASLVSAYSTLSELLADTDFRRLGELSLEDWTFHLSVVYGKTLDARAWTGLEAAGRRRGRRWPHPGARSGDVRHLPNRRLSSGVAGCRIQAENAATCATCRSPRTSAQAGVRVQTLEEDVDDREVEDHGGETDDRQPR
ncbi:2'-5' RNA ligase family protein [Microbacterium sp. A93]|uniref:2'-5' RNA ligase family protein n=1 Tax=Microbacterium sp. A93 TaxID=3450716 RepID=UPI003F444DAC